VRPFLFDSLVPDESMAARPNKLELRIIARIEREGPITFRDFMQTALYDPDYGYYNSERLKIGPQGDYYTSSNVHPAFGRILARAFAGLWSDFTADDASQPMTIVEMGAGSGQLACDVLTAMRDQHLPGGVDYVIVESSPPMRQQQGELLAHFSSSIRWCRLEELVRVAITGILFSNELIDAMPVHCVRLKGCRLEEQYVTLAAEGLTLQWNAPSTPNLISYLERAGVQMAEGQIAEVNLDAIEWLAKVSGALDRGFLITIDYGDLSGLLCGPDRRSGTLRSFYNHALSDSQLQRVGDQDITASVNFTALMEYGQDFGFETISYERQAAFLIRMGLIEMIAEQKNTRLSREGLKEQLALKNLFVPGGVSDNFRVLIQRKG
jgi:SAM-dependent MidA family methyltransferase